MNKNILRIFIPQILKSSSAHVSVIDYILAHHFNVKTQIFRLKLIKSHRHTHTITHSYTWTHTRILLHKHTTPTNMLLYTHFYTQTHTLCGRSVCVCVSRIHSACPWMALRENTQWLCVCVWDKSKQRQCDLHQSLHVSLCDMWVQTFIVYKLANYQCDNMRITTDVIMLQHNNVTTKRCDHRVTSFRCHNAVPWRGYKVTLCLHHCIFIDMNVYFSLVFLVGSWKKQSLLSLNETSSS